MKGDNSETVMDKEESFAEDFAMLIEYYVKRFKCGPLDATALMEYIENMTEDGQLIYQRQYSYLKRKQSSLVFTTETEIENDERVIIVSVYNKRVLPKNGLYRAYVYLPIEPKEQLTE